MKNPRVKRMDHQRLLAVYLKITLFVGCVLFLASCIPAEEQLPLPDEIIDAERPEQELPFNTEENETPPEESPFLQNITPNARENREEPEMMVENACQREFSPQFDAGPYYSGSLFDAHFHLPPPWEEPEAGFTLPVREKDITLSEILCYFDKEKVKGAITFNFWNYEAKEQSIQDLAELRKQLPSGIHLFLIPSELLAEDLDEIVASHKDVFDGFGEITHYDPERSGQTPDDSESLKMYNVAAEHGLVVMFHPGQNQRSKVEHALQKNPDTTFLLHGYESEDYIVELMDTYPNVYYSVDSATLYNLNGVFILGPREKFVSTFKDEFNSILNAKVNKWKPRIEKYPDRFMWGTDRAADWHFDEEISILFEEFARAFIGKLSPAVQEKYAYENAERLMKMGGG